MSLFVGNLSPHVRHQELERAFSRFGRSNLELKDGYGFVVYEEHRDAERALRALQGRLVCGERPSISWARRHRPFPRFSSKGDSFRRASCDKDQGRVSKRRQSLDSEKVSDDERKEHRDSDEEKNVSRASVPREDTAEKAVRDEEWKDKVTEKLALEENEAKELDPLDSGRWGEPLSEGSPDHLVGEGRREYEDDVLDKEKEDIEGSAHERSHGSPVDKSLERSSRAFRNSDEQYRRGRDFLGKPQERCFNCGQLGHIMRQCRSRANVNMYSREGFDGRRNQYRNFRGTGFRGMGGRFRGIEGPRRGFNRDMEGSYGRRNLRRQGYMGDRRLHEQIDSKSDGKNRRRHHRSDSQRDSPSRERSSRRRHKKSGKKSSSRSTRKRRRSSSESQSGSHSHSRSSSSSPSHSRSRSLPSRSQSSKSPSRSSSSLSHSRKSRSKSSRSHSVSVSSLSRSHSRTSRSGRTQSKSKSRSSKSRSRSASHSRSPQARSRSRDSRGLPSHSSDGNSQGSHGHSPELPIRSPKSCGLRTNEFEGGQGVAATSTRSERHEKQVTKKIKVVAEAEAQQKGVGVKDVEDSKQSSQEQEWETDEQYVMRKEKSRQGFKESKKQKGRDRSDVERLYREKDKLSNGGNHIAEHSKASAVDAFSKHDAAKNEGLPRDVKQQDHSTVPSGRFATSQSSSKGSEPENNPFLTVAAQDSTYSAYVAVMKEGVNRGVAHGGDGHEAAVQSFGAARLWPWEAMLYRKLKRGPISTANYERRKAQNEEFHIVDKFVRSSSGWWEKDSE